MAEVLAVAAGIQVVAKGHRRVQAAAIQVADGRAVEAQDVGQHAIEARAQQVAALGEERAQRVAVVLEVVGALVHREAHLGGLAGNVQSPSRPGKCG